MQTDIPITNEDALLLSRIGAKAFRRVEILRAAQSETTRRHQERHKAPPLWTIKRQPATK